MKWFYNLKIGTKLLAGFIFVALVAGVVGYVGIININEITARDTELYEYNTLPLADIGEASAGFQRIRINLRDICIDKDPAAKSKYVRDVEQLAKEVMEHLDKFEAKLQTQEGRNEFAKVKAATTKFVDLQEQIIQLATSGQAEAAMALLFSDAANKAAQEVNDGIVKLYQMKLDAANKLEVENDATSAAAVNTMLVFAGIAIALAIGLGIFITRIITRPVQHLQVVMTQVEQGDLTVRGEVNTKDELGQLAASFNQMLDYLREFVQKVQDGSRAVAAASEQISASTQQVASGAQSQAQEAQTLSKMMDDMTGASAQVAGSAQKAALSSEQTTAATDDGGRIIAQTVEGMDEIANNVMTLGQSSEKIGEIIEMIDDIAAQTNLLALNAAIEAARAGEAGKGFAVVADEVRKLAERSGAATKDIAVLIKNIQAVTTQAVAATENGRDLTHKAGAAFETIKDQVKQTAAEVAEIAAAAEEQAATVEQASQAVQNVAAISEESSAGAEETAGATQSMTHLAAELQAAAARYKV